MFVCIPLTWWGLIITSKIKHFKLQFKQSQDFKFIDRNWHAAPRAITMWKKLDLTTLDRGIYFRAKGEESYPLIGKSMAEIQMTL